MNTDPIADMLSRIRNAIAVNRASVNMPHSNLKEQVANLLKDRGFIDGVKTEEVGGFKRLVLDINQAGANARISTLKRLSKPGRRLYSDADKLPKSMSGRGIVIVSTSRGLMTDDIARKEHVGGELICEVY
ncbi:MAG TPA: 30S ribosomal protein S8 [Candidatus Saccharimonadales bacterium]|jgi:small subunit ribosomal protein S8